jgi:hypothetical protein
MLLSISSEAFLYVYSYTMGNLIVILIYMNNQIEIFRLLCMFVNICNKLFKFWMGLNFAMHNCRRMNMVS